jgi:hypothetical protein
MAETLLTAQNAVNKYSEIKSTYPKTALFLSFLPGIGQIFAAMDAGKNAYNGDYSEAALDALGLVSGGAMISKGLGVFGQTGRSAIADMGALASPAAVSALKKKGTLLVGAGAGVSGYSAGRDINEYRN